VLRVVVAVVVAANPGAGAGQQEPGAGAGAPLSSLLWGLGIFIRLPWLGQCGRAAAGCACTGVHCHCAALLVLC
jgi:hypothetical protein